MSSLAASTSLADARPPIALGALDGRYRGAVAPLVDHLSEPALNRARVHVEVEWLIHLTEREVVPGVRRLTASEIESLREMVRTFGAAEIDEMAATERVTQHDVKAVEYFVKKRLTQIAPDDADRGLAELIHFACTSEDVNNLSYAVMVKGAVAEVWLPRATALVEAIATMARDLRDVPLLAHTHGQPATPTTMGKELAVLAWRLQRQLARIEDAEFLGKLNGATGTYGAHVAAVPGADWQSVSREFVEHLGLAWNPLTTQIESHDWQSELYADIARFNRVLHNLCTDVWTYISMGYFAQVRGQGTVGSSTMPHKVNPIRFENAEANLEVSNALFDVLGATLVQSRLQRDLTDSSMQRNIGTAFGHSLLAIDNATRGLAGLDAVPAAMAADLDANWEVLGEPIQSAMRALGAQGVPGMEEPYERLKELTRGRRIGQAELVEFVHGLGLPAEVEARLAAMTPATYVGIAPQLVDHLALSAADVTGAGVIAIVAADLDDPRVGVLLTEHLAEMEPTAPPESRHALTADQFRMPGVRLWVAERENDSAAALLGSVALKEVAPGHLEIKTMRVTASGRGLGLGRRLLDHALAQAHLLGATRVSLETGVAPAFDAARSLYASAGFTPCEPFGAYRPDRHSIFLTRPL